MNDKEQNKGRPSRFSIWLAEKLFGPNLPEDPVERRRIKALMLGAGAGGAMRPAADGKVHIEHIKMGENVEDDN